MSIVILPAYKPDENLVTIANQLWSKGYRVIVVDDGSGEEYRGIFEKIQDICIILRQEVNRGKGEAIKKALKYIRAEIHDCDVIGIMDSDGQHLADDMEKLLLSAEEHKNALVLGVRTIGKEMPLKSRLGNQITRMIFWVISGADVSDTQTGLRAFSSELLDRMIATKGERYEYEMNVLMAAAKDGIPFKEVKIHTIYHDRDNSCSHFRILEDSIRIYKDIILFALSSLSGFVVDYQLFAFLMLCLPHTAFSVFAANLIARVVSSYYNYSMNCRFVFHMDRRMSTATGYFGLAVIIFIMNVLILEMFVQVLHFSVYPAKLLTECLLFCLSWFVQKRIIFRKRNV